MSNNNTRREFLSKSFVGLASFGLLGFSKEKLIANCQEKPAAKEIPTKTGNKLPATGTNKIIYRTLGKTKIKIPIISMGVMNADLPELLEKSYEIGMRHFDTAAGYQNGKNEEMVGDVIKKLGVRNKVTIATKANIKNKEKMTPDELKEKFLEIFEGSLKRLKMNYVDILYYHGISNPEDLQNSGIKEAFTLLKKQKKIRFCGASTHGGMTKVLNEATSSNFYDVILTSFNFKLGDNKDFLDAAKNAADKGVGIVAMKTQAGGKQGNQTALLKWVLRHEYVTTAIPGYTNYDHMNENWSVANNIEYTNEEKEFLKNKKADIGMGFCRQCEKCLPTCPKSVDIPTLMRTYMYAAQYANFAQARYTLDEIPEENGLMNCSLCSTCSAKCVKDVNIAKGINDLKLMYC